MRRARRYCGESSSKRSHVEHCILDGREVSRSLSSAKSRRKHFGDEEDVAYEDVDPEDDVYLGRFGKILKVS